MMDQFISKPLKKFLYNSKEFGRRRRDKNNLNAVQYSAGSDEAIIKMTEIKSIMRSSQKIQETNLDSLPTTTKQLTTKNNVLFSDSIETIDSDGSQHFVSNSDNEIVSDNNNSTQLVKVKLLNEPVKETPTVLNLNLTNSSGSVQDNLESDGDIHLDNFARQSIIKIKVKVINKNNLEVNDSRSDESNTKTIEDKSDALINSSSTPEKSCDKFKNFEISSNDESNLENVENKSVRLNNSIVEEDQNITENIPEEFQNMAISENKHNVGDSCIFSENKSRPLSPIPVIPPQISPKTNPFRTVDNLIDFHERQVHKPIGRSPPKTLPRMGTSALLNRSHSKSKLNDSEIISELVRDRFVVNMYESRSCRRNSVKKPCHYGRIYKSLERTVNFYNNDFFTKQNLLTSDIVTIKQSSPIKLKDQAVSSQASPVKPAFKLEELFPSEATEDVQEINVNEIKNLSSSQEQIQAKESTETLCKEELQNTPSSEYGSGTSSIQDSTISLEQQLEQISGNQYENTFGSEDSSYNMEEFLKKALGDELNNLDSTEISSKASLAAIPQEDSITTSNASDLISKINTFQSNLYRSFTKKLQHVSDTLRLPHGQGVQQKHQDKQSVKSDLDSLFSNNEEVTALLRQAAVQYEALKQISKALTVCRNSKEFCCSSEQVEGERLLLIATYKRQAILDEIRRLEYTPASPTPSSETGCVTINNIILPLKPSSPEQPRGSLTKWYVAVFTSGLQVTATKPTLATDGSVKFVEEVMFKNLPTDFEVNVEVYCLLQRRQGRNFSHESKYHINKDTKRSHCPTPKKFLSRDKTFQKPPLYDTGIRTSSFKLCGNLKLKVADLATPGRWDLKGKIPLCSALQGFICLNLNSVVDIPIKQAGFLTVGSESGGYAAWNRRWCVLDGTVIKYWNYPSEEESPALKEFDLKYCVSSKIEHADRSICARPRTLLVEIARMAKPEDADSMMMACSGCYTVERYYLSADSTVELNVWQESLDKVVQALRIWNVGFLS